MVLLAAIAFFFYTFLRDSLGVRAFPSIAGALLTIFHFSWVDVLYQYAGQFYLWGSIFFILLLKLTFAPQRTRGLMLAVGMTFFIGLLTVHSVVILMPLLLFHLFSKRDKMSGEFRRTFLAYAATLALPLLAIGFLERWRSGPLPLLTTSTFAVLKNYVVSSGCLFYNFKPFGFTEIWQTGELDFRALMLFLWSNPQAAAMVAGSQVFTGGALFLIYRGDYKVRLLTLGAVLDILIFCTYVGTAPRFLTLSVLCVFALFAYRWSSHVPPGRRWLGLLLFAVLVAYNWHLSVKQRELFFADIGHTEALRQTIESGRDVSPEDLPTVEELKEFWRK